MLSTLTLTANPTMVATAGALTQYGVFQGELFQHDTAATDTNWTNLGAVLSLSRNVGPLSTLADFASPLSDLATKRVQLDRLVLNAYGDFIDARALIQIWNGQPSAIVDNDKLTVPLAGNLGFLLLEFKRTGGFVPTPGCTTVDLSALVDSPDDTAPSALAHAIAEKIAVEIGGDGWSTTAEESSPPTSHWIAYIANGDGELRLPAPAWALATPNAYFSGSIARAGYSPLVAAHGGVMNNLTRLGPTDVAALIALLTPGPVGGIVRVAEYDVDFSMFTGDGGVTHSTVRLGPDLPAGALLVGASAHIDHAWAAPSLATLTLEFDDQTNGTASLVKPIDGTDPTAGGNIGRARTGRAISYPTCTARITGDVLASLTSGTAKLEVLYRIP